MKIIMKIILAHFYFYFSPLYFSLYLYPLIYIMGKKSLKRKTTKKTRILKNKQSSKRRTIHKRRRTKTQKKMGLHCRCKRSRRTKKTRKHKLKGGGNFNLSNLVPQDIRSMWSNAEYNFHDFGNKIAGIKSSVSPMVTDQPGLAYNKMPMPSRTNIGGSNAAASEAVNNMF
jgi:hypothetical protein